MKTNLTCPIDVSSIDDLRGLKKYQMIRYTCRNCGATVERLWLSHRRNIIERFLCRRCNSIQTCKEKYGVDNVMHNETIKQKVFNTNIEKYGNKCSLRNKNVYEKAKETWLEKYGVINPFNTEEVKKKARKGQAGKRFYYKDGEVFDSSWELAFWIYHRDNNIPIIREPTKLYFTFEGKQIGYIPDFEVNGILYEIKGDQFFNENNNLISPYNPLNNDLAASKQKCMEDNNIIIIRREQITPYLEFVQNKYGKDYLNQFCQKYKK